MDIFSDHAEDAIAIAEGSKSGDLDGVLALLFAEEPDYASPGKQVEECHQSPGHVGEWDYTSPTMQMKVYQQSPRPLEESECTFDVKQEEECNESSCRTSEVPGYGCFSLDGQPVPHGPRKGRTGRLARENRRKAAVVRSKGAC